MTNALWQPQAHMPSVLAGDRMTIVSGEGANVTTADGRTLLDATAGLWHANIGHGRPELAEAAAAQMRTLETYHTFGRIVNDQALALADRLEAMSPIAEPKVFFVSGGSDAIDTAGKLARRFWQHRGHANKRILISRLAAEIERLGPDRVAAYFAEPIIGTGGVILPAPGYLQRAEEICRAYDVLFVADEVITGFGRTGVMFATELFELRPDMVVMAKGITSGYAPLGGLLIAPTVWEPFFDSPDAPIFRHGVTYSGHATACAVAQANLDVIESENLVAHVKELEPELVRAMEQVAKHPAVAEVRTGIGLLAGVNLVEDVSADLITRVCLEAGVLLRALPDNTLQISPPFVVEEGDLWRIAGAIAVALDHPDLQERQGSGPALDHVESDDA